MCLYWKLFYSFLHLAETFSIGHCLCFKQKMCSMMASLFAQLYYIDNVFLGSFLHISTSYLRVSYLSWELVMWCPTCLFHSGLEGAWAKWQQQDIQGGMLGCKVHRLVDAWQLAWNTVMLDTTTTAIMFLLYPPTTQMKNRGKVINKSFSSQKMFYQLIHMRIFLKYQGWL